MRLGSLTRREMRRRPGRTFLTISGIAIGVAAIVAVDTTIETTQSAWRDLFETMAGRGAFEVVAEGSGPFSPTIVTRVEVVPGVRRALPVVQGPAAIVGSKRRVPAMILGIDEVRDRELREYALASGSFLENPGEVLLESSFASELDVVAGGSIRLLAAGGMAELRVAGLLEPRGPAAANGGAVIVMGLATAQRAMRIGDRLNSVLLFAEEGATLATLRSEVSRVLPDGLTIQEPAARAAVGRESLARANQVLSLISVFSLVAGTFVVLNAFLMHLSERRRSLAILRALGTTRRQLRRMLLAGLLEHGTLGTVIGVLLGIASSAGTTMGLAQVMSLNLPTLQIAPMAIVKGLLVGPLAALAAGFVPGSRASQRAPLDDLMGRTAIEPPSGYRKTFVIGVLCVASSLALLAVFMKGLLARNLVTTLIAPGSALFLVGWVLMIPTFSPYLGRLTHRIARPMLGVEGLLAFRQLDRNRTRTSLTVGVLFISVVVTIGLGNATVSSSEDVMDWYDRTITADYFIRGVMPDGGTLTSARIPDDLLPAIEQVPGVASVRPLRFIQARAGGQRVIVIALPYAADRPPDLEIVQGDPATVLEGLRNGQVVLGSPLARRLDVGCGDQLTIQTRHGPRELLIAGVVTAYTGGGSVVGMDWATAERHFDVDGVDAYTIEAELRAPAGLEHDLRSLAEEHGLMFQTRQQLTAFMEEMLAGVNGMLWALLAVMFLVASLGTVNSLTMNVLDQVREIGVLRAVALKRNQLRRMILSQGFLIAVAGILPGLLVGMALAFILHAASPGMTGYEVEFSLRPAVLIGTFALVIVMTLFASLLPARKAARLSIIEALHYQ